jgi:hypothetical protein
MSEEQIEKLARALCEFKGIDPDATGVAIKDDTRAALGSSYPLWKYQAREVEFILTQIDS